MTNERTDKLCIIMDPNFGSRLKGRDEAVPIWIVQSAVNSPVVEALRRDKVGDITSFVPQDFDELIATVDLHHPTWCELEVIGIDSQQADNALNECGPGTIRATAEGFLFRKQAP